MPQTLPDPHAVAQQEAQRIADNRELALARPLERILIDSPMLDAREVLEGIEAFHRERMARVPSPARYPESPAWVEHQLRVDAELQRLASLTVRELALYRSLQQYVLFRGFREAGRRLRPVPAGDERCRVAYLPESDHGRVHIKNLDDPCAHWKPEGRPTWRFGRPGQTLWSDGVGSGLHIDDEPEELFPLPALAMMGHYCHDVPSAVEFLTRYSPFWGRGNLLLHDAQKRSAAIEKCSYSYIEVFYPGADGRSHISGMTCRDPGSPQGRYQRARRDEYLRLFDLPTDGADTAFWATAWRFETKLADALAALGDGPRLEDVLRLFTTPWPAGLNKTGAKVHRDQKLIAYTLMTAALLPDQRKLLRWQRSEPPELRYPDEPEVFEF